MISSKHLLPSFFLFLLIAVSSLFAGLLFGSVNIPPSQVATALLSPGDDAISQIVWQLRLPRVLAAFASGGLLALAGALLQVLLRNPLADPYILGVSGGAAVGALTAMLLGWGLALVNLTSMAGALTAIAIVFGLSFRNGDWNVYRLLLTGVVLSAGCAALTTLILTLAPASDVKGMLFWMMGDVSRAVGAEGLLSAWLALVIVTAMSMLFSSSLNVLSLGQMKAKALGVAVLPLQVGIYFCAALATVASLLMAGAIGFVGLIIPHVIRLLGINDHRWLLPLAMLWASKERFQLNVAWEPVYWFTNDPVRVRSDNRRVLQPHSERHLKLIAQGGVARTGSYGDGANNLKPGAFGRPTDGKIPKNVFQIAHRCPSQFELRKELQAQGLPMHGATMPARLARFLIEFLTEKGDLVADTCSGWATTAKEAEETGRRWIVSEKMLEYVRGSQHRFVSAPGFASALT